MTSYTQPSTQLQGRTVVVVGGTGNVGFFLVDALLQAGADVLVPSRSTDRFARLTQRLPDATRDRVTHLIADLTTPAGAHDLAHQVSTRTCSLAAVIAAPASWHQTNSMLSAGFEDFRSTLQTRLFPHYLAVEHLLPLVSPRGAYVFINGPVAFLSPTPAGTGAIATAATAQSGLMRSVAGETDGVMVNEVVVYAFLGPHGTRSGSQLPGEDVGAYVTALIGHAQPSLHSQTLHLRDSLQVQAAVGGHFAPASIETSA